MKLTFREICEYTDSTATSRNFVEGERVFMANHVIFCGKKCVHSDSVEIIAFCLQTSSLRNEPHEIVCSISNSGKILDAKCKCKAGMSKKCKHCVAVFLHLNRVDIQDLDLVSCTDTKCLWKVPHQKSIEEYIPKPMCEHKCVKEKFEKGYEINLNQQQRDEINKILFRRDRESALSKHVYD